MPQTEKGFLHPKHVKAQPSSGGLAILFSIFISIERSVTLYHMVKIGAMASNSLGSTSTREEKSEEGKAATVHFMHRERQGGDEAQDNVRGDCQTCRHEATCEEK